MNPPTTNRFKVFVISLIILILLVFIGLAVYVKFFRVVPDQIQNFSKAEEEALFAVKNFPPSELPEGFPQDLPLEKGTIIYENYTKPFTNKENNVRLKDGTLATLPEFKQSTYSFLSNKSLEENYKTYKAYFTTQKYKVLTESKTQNMVVIALVAPEKVNESIQFSASYDPISKKILVVIDKIFPIFTIDDVKNLPALPQN